MSNAQHGPFWNTDFGWTHFPVVIKQFMTEIFQRVMAVDNNRLVICPPGQGPVKTGLKWASFYQGGMRSGNLRVSLFASEFTGFLTRTKK
jgi:hypothetical protein